MLRVLLIVLTSTVTVQRRQWVTLPASEQSWVVAPGPTAVHVSATMRSRQEEGTYSSGAVTLTSLPRPQPAGHGHSFVTICVKSWRGGGPREALPRISTALLGKGAPGLLAASLFQTQLLLDRRWHKTPSCRLGYAADIFPKMNKVKLSFQREQLTIFIANDKIQAFKQGLGFRRTWVLHGRLNSFPRFKVFSNGTEGV